MSIKLQLLACSKTKQTTPSESAVAHTCIDAYTPVHPLHLRPSALVIVTYFSCVTVSVWPLTVVTVSAVRTPPLSDSIRINRCVCVYMCVCFCVCVSITLQTFLKYWAQVEQIYFCEQVQAHQWLLVFFWKNDVLDKSSGWESLFMLRASKVKWERQTWANS